MSNSSKVSQPVQDANPAMGSNAGRRSNHAFGKPYVTAAHATSASVADIGAIG
jgi:hypothetical protein